MINSPIEDDVIYGQIDNLIYPSYDVDYADQKKSDDGLRYHGVIFIRDRYINNIILDPSQGQYLYLGDEITTSDIDLTLVLPYDQNIQEHYYIHFLSLVQTESINLNVTFCIEDPEQRQYNKKHIWQKRKYRRMTLPVSPVKLYDLLFLTKDRHPEITSTSLGINLRDYRQAISHRILTD